MAAEVLVENRIEDGRKLLAELPRNGVDVTLAFWANSSENSRWTLYIVSDQATPGKRGDVALKLYTSLSRIPDSDMDSSDVILLYPAHPLAAAALAVRPPSLGGGFLTRVTAKAFRIMSIEEVYIYPKTTGPMTREEVINTVFGLLVRPGSSSPPTVTLRDGSVMQAVPVGLNLQKANGAEITLHDLVTGTDRLVAADDVESIR